MFRFSAAIAFVFSLVFNFSALAVTAQSGEKLALQDLSLTIPEGWQLHQDAKDGETIILGFSNENEYLTIFVKRATSLNMKSLFANDATIVEDTKPVIFNSLEWKQLRTSKEFTAQKTTFYITSFLTELEGVSYYGYSRSDDTTRSLEITELFLQEITR